MTGRHHAPDDPTPRTDPYRATALVHALTGVTVEDTSPTRHDGSQTPATPDLDEVDQ